jgi:hypothetical protein
VREDVPQVEDEIFDRQSSTEHLQHKWVMNVLNPHITNTLLEPLKQTDKPFSETTTRRKRKKEKKNTLV